MKGFSQEDLLQELLKSTFSEENVNKIYKSGLDINWQRDGNESYLHLCAGKNLTKSIEWLLKNGANIELENKEGLTPVFYAVENNAVESLKLLIKNNANIDHQDMHKRTALQEAVITNKKRVVDLLLEHSTNVNNIDNYGRNVIFDAVANGNRDLVLKIADAQDLDINQIDETGRTILHQKEVLNDEEMAISLMEKGADPTIKDANGKNFLFYAAANGIESERIFDKAISLNCDINTRNNKKQTILMETLLVFVDVDEYEQDRRQSLMKMLKKLINLGIDINSADVENETALFIAVRNKDLEATALILAEEGVEIDHQNANGETVLMIAALEGIENLDLILILLQSGADPNVQDFEKETVIEKLINTVLHYHNDVDNDEEHNEDGQYLLVLKEILNNSDVDLDQLNSKGKPYFFDALFYQNQHLFKLLRNFGIEINQKDNEGNNVIHNLLNYNQTHKKFNKKQFMDILRHLISLGIDVNSRDNSGATTMHKAILGDSEPALKALLNAKANINAVDKRGRSLIHNCIWGDNIKFFKIVHSQDTQVLNKPDKFGILPINYAAFMGYSESVIAMIEAGSYINNTNQKNDVVVHYLRQFAHNLDLLQKEVTDELNKKNIKLLIDNMKDEFKIQ